MKKMTTTIARGLVLLALGGCASSSVEPGYSRSPAQDRGTTQAVFPDDQAKCASFTDTIAKGQSDVIAGLMSQHMHRLDHLLWHATRNGWDQLTEIEKAAIQTLNPEWGKNAPLCGASRPENDPNNPAGEEFLYMHHTMVDLVRQTLVAQKQSCIAGWTKLPLKDDADFPVPAGDPKDSSKSDDTGAMMQAWMDKLDDAEYLKGKTLSYVGYLIEFSIHNNMHMRWATMPNPGDDFDPVSSRVTSHSLVLSSAKYDAASHNWLGNPYDAHVNPTFWKLHGWVDSVIPKWLKANGYERIAKDCSGKTKCYQWKSTWVGAPMGDAAMAMMMGVKHPMHHAVRVPASAADTAAADAALKKIAHLGGFSNQKFNDAVNAPPTDGGTRRGLPGNGAPARDTSMDDPIDFLKKYGPCN